MRPLLSILAFAGLFCMFAGVTTWIGESGQEQCAKPAPVAYQQLRVTT